MASRPITRATSACPGSPARTATCRHPAERWTVVRCRARWLVAEPGLGPHGLRQAVGVLELGQDHRGVGLGDAFDLADRARDLEQVLVVAADGADEQVGRARCRRRRSRPRGSRRSARPRARGRRRSAGPRRTPGSSRARSGSSRRRSGSRRARSVTRRAGARSPRRCRRRARSRCTGAGPPPGAGR